MLAWGDCRGRCRKMDFKRVIKTGCSQMPNESLGTPPQSEHINDAPFKFTTPLRLNGKKYFFRKSNCLTCE
ncbi:hypothetical protein C0R09_04020 [Brevibacillus laterosporus]|nr:hypothetical protein C0R09_04020 [Brevibacillus laterosporus]